VRETRSEFCIRERAAKRAEAANPRQGQDGKAMRNGEALQTEAGVDSIDNRNRCCQKNAGDEPDLRTRMGSGKRSGYRRSRLRIFLIESQNHQILIKKPILIF